MESLTGLVFTLVFSLGLTSSMSAQVSKLLGDAEAFLVNLVGEALSSSNELGVGEFEFDRDSRGRCITEVVLNTLVEGI